MLSSRQDHRQQVLKAVQKSNCMFPPPERVLESLMAQHISDVEFGGMEALSCIHLFIFISVHSIYIKHLLYVRHFAKNRELRDG